MRVVAQAPLCARIGMRLNRGDGGEYGVQVHYVGARFFSSDKAAAGPPALQLRYREAIAAGLERVQRFQLSPLHSQKKETCRHPDLLFSLDRHLDFDQGIVELLRRTGRLPLRR